MSCNLIEDIILNSGVDFQAVVHGPLKLKHKYLVLLMLPYVKSYFAFPLCFRNVKKRIEKQLLHKLYSFSGLK